MNRNESTICCGSGETLRMESLINNCETGKQKVLILYLDFITVKHYHGKEIFTDGSPERFVTMEGYACRLTTA